VTTTYDLSDPGFLDRAKQELKTHGRRLVEIVNKVRLRADTAGLPSRNTGTS
jgi:hypothetical protein